MYIMKRNLKVPVKRSLWYYYISSEMKVYYLYVFRIATLLMPTKANIFACECQRFVNEFLQR